MLLSNSNVLFKTIIENASRSLRISESYIEKDFYAISILKELISRNDKFVFKGGTSLSVCQGIINRFSEDIDISYENETITVGERKAIKQTFFDSIENVSLKVSNSEDIKSRKIFNQYLCHYKSVWNSNGDKVIVEWATQTPAFPIEIKTAQTIIGKYLTSIGRTDLINQYNLEPFPVKTITMERTLVDKAFAICDYYLTNKLDRQSRHTYDIYKLLKHVELNDEFIALFCKVKEYRCKLTTCLSAISKKPLSQLLAELVEQKTFLTDYKEKTFELLYDGVKYEDCIPSIIQLSSFLKSHSL